MAALAGVLDLGGLSQLRPKSAGGKRARVQRESAHRRRKDAYIARRGLAAPTSWMVSKGLVDRVGYRLELD